MIKIKSSTFQLILEEKVLSIEKCAVSVARNAGERWKLNSIEYADELRFLVPTMVATARTLEKLVEI